MTKKYTIGDYTNCRYDICEILEDGEFFCVVGTDYVKSIINVLEENEQLKSELGEKDIQLDFLKAENIHMSDLVNENKELKQQIKALDDTIDGLTETIFHYNIERDLK